MYSIIYQLFVDSKIKKVPWTLSEKKHINGHKYLYKQYKNKTEYVRRSDEAQVKKEFQEKQYYKNEKRKIKAEFQALSPKEKREINQRIKLYQELKLDQIPKEKDVSFDGTLLDSRAEIILYEFLKSQGLKTKHNEPLDPYEFSYLPDFTFKINEKTYYLEHMGKLEDKKYHKKQKIKIKNYKIKKININDNLIITTSNQKFNAPKILWHCVLAGILPARKARKIIKK